MVENWEKLNSQPISDQRIFQVRHDTRRSPRTGNDHTFVVLEAPDWINIIPLTAAGNVVLIHQFRHGTAEVTLEIPGGIVDPEDASPLQAAVRELKEETGYEVGQVIPIGSVTPNPAFLENRCHTYLALDAHPVATPQFDGTEDIAVEEYPLTAVPDLIHSGQINHALVICAFYHLDNYRRRHPEWEMVNG